MSHTPVRIPRWVRNAFFVSFAVSAGTFGLIVAVNLGLGQFVTAVNLAYTNFLIESESASVTRANPSVLVVEIDDRTLDNPERGGLGRWQDFRREWYAKAIENLASDGAAVVGLDVLLSEPSRDPDDDTRLTAALSKYSDHVVLGYFARDTNVPAVLPLEDFDEQARAKGFLNQRPHDANSTIYTVEAYRPNQGAEGIVESFSFAILRRYYETVFGMEKTIPTVAAVRASPDAYPFLLDDPLNIRVPYARGAGGNDIFFRYRAPETFARVSFRDVLARNYPKDLVKDKIVLIGATATALGDQHRVAGGIVPGVYIHADAIDSVLNRRFFTVFDRGTELISLGLVTFILAGLGFTLGNLLVFGAVCIGTVALFAFASIALAADPGLLFATPIDFFLAVVLVFIGVSICRYVYEDAGKRLLQETLSQYLAQDLVLRVLDNYESVRLGGARREIVTFFSDIAGFTALSERLQPEELVRHLSVYLREMSDIIIAKKGYINKYEGDAIMALWGAFGATDRRTMALHACEAALAQQRRLHELNERLFKRYGIAFRTRMGLSLGEAIVGNIGSLGKKIEFTALGDTVNLASRLEGANKFYGTRVIVTESVALAVGDAYVFRRLDNLRVHGKSDVRTVYELVGATGEVTEESLGRIRRYEDAFDRFAAGDFASARTMLESLSREWSEDEASRLLLERCLRYEADPPSDWDGSYSPGEK